MRLELGLGGQSMEDTLLFGTKVLSLPGSLSRKNISDVENNVVDASTSWKHQEAYARMVIAGCINQAKRIVACYDEVLYGPPPEKLVNSTHKAITDLLVSEEARVFLEAEDESSPSPNPERERFIKKIVGAVAPIIPIAIRNKSLDGSYLRTALHMLGAAEVFLSRYVTDIRSQANPAGIVGACTAMHAEFKRSTRYTDELKPLQDFIQSVKTQYQTSLGLGTPFLNDKASKTKRRNREAGYARGRYWRRGASRFGSVGGRGEGRGSNQPTSENFRDPTYGLPSSAQLGGRRVCYDYQAGACRRGGLCRFAHPQ